MQLIADSQTFNRADLLVPHGPNSRYTRAGALPVDKHGAGAAAALPAAVLAACEAKVVAQDAEKTAILIGSDGMTGTVYMKLCQGRHEALPLLNGSQKRGLALCTHGACTRFCGPVVETASNLAIYPGIHETAMKI